jgi:PST family polysaccharide transporter
MIIGRYLGAGSLGLYSLAYRLMLFPLQNLTFVASRALFPIMSRQQAVPEEMVALYLRALTLIAFVTAPMMAGLTVLRELFISVMLGNRWLAMGDILLWLAPVGFLGSLTSTTGSVLMAKGRTDVLFYLGIAGVVTHLAAFFIGVRWGVTGVAAGYFFANLAEFVPVFYVVFRILGQGISPFLRSVLPPIALAGAMALVVLGCKEFLPLSNAPEVIQLALLVLVGAVTYSGMAFLFARQSLKDVIAFFRGR